MIIKRADEMQLEMLEQLEKDVFSSPWTKSQILSEISSEYGLVLTAFDNDYLCAFCIMHMAGDQAELYRIATDSRCRRQGIAESLLKRGIAWAVNRSAESIFLEVRSGNASAIALYEKLGFESVGIRKKYYTAPSEDAVIMVRKVTEDDNSCS